MHQIFWRSLRNIRTFLDSLRGVDPLMGRELVSRTWAKFSKNMGEWGVNISASITAPGTKYFWRFLRHIGTFLDCLGGVDAPMGRALAPKTRPNWANTFGGWEVNISFSIRAPKHQILLEVPETNGNISTQPMGCWHTYRWAKIHQKQPHYLQTIFAWFKLSQHQFLSYTHNRIIHNAIYIGIWNGTHLWEVCLVQNVCYAVKHSSCSPFALTVDWMPAKYSIKLGDVISQNKFGPWDSISSLDVCPHPKWVPLCAGTWPPGGQVLAHRPLGDQVWAPLKLSCVHFSLCLHVPNFLEVPETHRETFVDYLGDVDTTVGRVPVSKSGPSWANTWESGEVNRSASVKTPCTKCSLEVSETHSNISRPCGRCWYTHG